MLSKYVQEIAIDDMNWEKANALTKILVENGYAVLTTIEEQLIVINYVYANSYPIKTPDRNNVVFMTTDEYWDMRDEEMKEVDNERD